MKTATVIEDSDGQLMFQFDSDTLSQMGWDIGDDLVWTDNFDGSFSLHKKVDKSD